MSLDELPKAGQFSVQRDVVLHRLHDTVPSSMMSGINACETNAAYSVRVEVIGAGHSGPMQHGKLLTEFVGRQPVSWFVCQAAKQQQCVSAKFGFFRQCS